MDQMQPVGRISLASVVAMSVISLSSAHGLPSAQELPTARAHQMDCRFGNPNAFAVRTERGLVYVNPMSTGVRGDRIAFSGTPNYLWQDTTALFRQLFAVVVDREGDARLIPPLSDDLAPQALLAPNFQGGWRAVFPAYPRSSGQPDSTALRTATWVDSWSGSELLRLPDSLWLGEFERGRAAFVTGAEETWIAVVAMPREHLVVFERQRADTEWREWVGSPNTMLMAADVDGRGVVIAYIDYSPPHGNRLMVVRPSAEGSRPRELYRWPGTSLTVNSMQALAVGDSLFILVGEDVPTLYVSSSDGKVERLRVRTDSDESVDVFLSALPNDYPVLVMQPRRLQGGVATIGVHSIYGAELFSSGSPFVALQSVITTPDGLVLIGTSFPLGESSPVFATSVASVHVSCPEGGRK